MSIPTSRAVPNRERATRSSRHASMCASAPGVRASLARPSICSRISSSTMWPLPSGWSPTSQRLALRHEGEWLMPDQTAGELFHAGQLTAAIEAANAAVRNNPADFTKRLLLAELLVFAGNLQRADVILDAAARADPTTAV